MMAERFEPLDELPCGSNMTEAVKVIASQFNVRSMNPIKLKVS
jgi:hypothetical protein